MRVLFTTWPAKAHLYPVAPLAWALQNAGHEVRVAAHPMMAETIRSLGLVPVALGEDGPLPESRTGDDTEANLDRLAEALDLSPGDRYLWDTLRTFILPLMWDFHPLDRASDTVDAAVDELVRFARHWEPDLVLWDPCWPSAAVAARAAGAAHARLLWGQDYWGWAIDRFAERRRVLGAALGENPMVDTVRPVADHYGVEVDDELLLGQWTVDPVPSGMRLGVTHRTIPMRWVPYTGTAVVPEWLYARPERPRVAISLGVSMRTYFKESQARVASLLEMVSTMDVEVVATLDKRQLEGITTLPDNVRTVDYMPLTLLLPTTSAFIHHGGIGSFAAAATANVPQLITSDENDFTTVDDEGNEHTFATQHMDVPATSSYLERSGAGLTLDHRRLTIPEMRDRLERVLSEPSFRRGAAGLRNDLLAAPGPAEVVPLLERLTRENRSGG
ncbi:nucleotide disphospho-sugar-binding domain-containing protein [Streptomyces sp. NPDC088180]|uniref:nucleotide disphospho-sugar-binding domain-containing protein n=1 Tax=Streptomyces sp. NPDC088180 TaxID=3365837 RepID=UPI0038267F16